MKFFRIIEKFFSFIYFFTKYKNIKIAYYFSHYHVSYYDAAMVNKKGSNLIFKNSGNELPIDKIPIFQLALTVLISVLNNSKTKIVSLTQSGFVLEIEGFTIVAQSLSNIVAINEVFVEKLYHISFDSNENIILDIGMNVGYASLFFASLKEVSHIYSFEPFPGTFKEAVENINLNKELKNKITPLNQGISDYTGILKVPFFESGSLMASTNSEMIKGIKTDNKNFINVDLKNIEEVINEIFLKHTDQNIILKIDCEGEEYGIIKKLDSAGQIKKIKCLIIEWHLNGASSIIETLKANGFTTLDLARTDVATGMLYAFKQ